MRRVHDPPFDSRLVVAQQVRRDGPVIIMQGVLDHWSVPAASVAFVELDPASEYQLDLSQLDFLDVGGAVLLARMQSRFYAHGGALHVCDATPLTHRLLHLVGSLEAEQGSATTG